MQLWKGKIVNVLVLKIYTYKLLNNFLINNYMLRLLENNCYLRLCRDYDGQGEYTIAFLILNLIRS